MINAGLDCSRRSERGTSLSGRGQWVCASKRPAMFVAQCRARKKRKLIAELPRSHCSSTFLCPLASMLTPRSTLCRGFFWIHE